MFVSTRRVEGTRDAPFLSHQSGTGYYFVRCRVTSAQMVSVVRSYSANGCYVARCEFVDAWLRSDVSATADDYATCHV